MSGVHLFRRMPLGQLGKPIFGFSGFTLLVVFFAAVKFTVHVLTAQG